jgi:PBSX family phage terminase large subunit
MIYTPKQRALMELWRTNKLRRINLLEGSVSSGKTWVSLVLWAFWVKTMPDSPSCLYLMSARSLTTLKRNCLLLLQSLVGEGNFTFSISSKEGQLFGRRILLEGANDAQAEAKIRGLTLQGAYCDELTKMQEDFFSMLLSRLRLPGAKLIATTNPDAPSHWLKERYIDRRDELDFLDVRFLIDDNTTLPADYVENIKKEYTGVFYQRFILGEWTLAEGLIYPMYADAIAEPPEGDPEQRILSIDYGTMNAFAAGLWSKYTVDGRTVWYMTDEYYYSGRDTGAQKTDAEYAEEIDRFTDGLADEWHKLKTIIDPSAASFIALLRKRGRYNVIPADNAVIDGIRETASCLQLGKIKISPRCKSWKKEAQGYVWDQKATDDRPIKVDDHMMDAMRYFCKTMNIAKQKAAYTPIYMRQ